MLGAEDSVSTELSLDINQLIENNLFQQMDLQTQQVLRCLSIFDSFTIQQAEMVLEKKTIRNIVKQLVNKNAFIEYDRITETYKLHNILLDYLRDRVDSNSAEMKHIYRRTGQWFIGRGDYVTAFDYYHRAGEMNLLLEYLSKQEKVNISFLGNELMYRIYKEMPRHLPVKYPILFLQIALNFLLSSEKALIEKGLEIISSIRDFYGQTGDFPTNLCDKVFAEIEVIEGIMAFNDIEVMLAHSKKATKLFHGGMSSLIFRHSEFTFGLPHFLYSYYTKPGKLRESVDYLVEGFPMPYFDGCGTGCDSLTLAEYALETADLEQVENYARKAIYKARTKNQISIELAADFTLMRLYLMEGNVEKAKDLPAKARALLYELNAELPIQNRMIYNTTLDLCEGYFYGCLKRADQIPEWLRKGDFSNAAYMFHGMGFPYILYGKAILLSENWVKLEVLCDSFRREFDQCHNQIGLLHNSIYEAVAKYNLYGKEEGLKALLPALKEAQLDGILFPFVENADFLMPMLRSLGEKDGLDIEYLNKLRSLCNRYSQKLKVFDRKNTVLTERELQVLVLLEEGLTQKEIAERLILSASTVKRHLENIYQKLDVNNKIGAIKSARKMKLL